MCKSLYISSQTGLINFQINSKSIPSLIIGLGVSMLIWLICMLGSKCRHWWWSNNRLTSAITSVAQSMRAQASAPLMTPPTAPVVTVPPRIIQTSFMPESTYREDTCPRFSSGDKRGQRETLYLELAPQPS